MPNNFLRHELRILFITPEIYPLCKTGGLGDVSAALPAALRALHLDIRILIPGYPQVMSGITHKVKVAEFNNLTHFPRTALLSANLPTRGSKNVPIFIIDCPDLYEREGGPYLDATGSDWSDNALRFGLLSKIGAILASDDSPLTWHPHIAHCNDWQSGLTPAYLHFYQGQKAASLMTIHNLAFQGVFPVENVEQLGLPATCFDINGVEYFGSMSFLKAGLYYAQHITTVSPSYAKEIQKAPLGFGMQGLLAARHENITGIINGIDIKEWDPATDPHIACNYTSKTLPDKANNKAALQKRVGLTIDPSIPLFGAISRFSHQKGYDLLLQVASQLIQLPAQLVILGSGDSVLEHELAKLAKTYPGKIAVHIGYNEGLSHLIEAGIDCFLMPSRFEPCGLNQMYSQRYATPPLVHATGGLRDTVVDCTPITLEDGTASGFVFYNMTADNLLTTIKRAADTFNNKETWQLLQKNGMAKDFNWCSSAAKYREIYLSLSS